MSKKRDYFWIIFSTVVAFLACTTAVFAYFNTVWAPQFVGVDAPVGRATSTAPFLNTRIPFDGTLYGDSFTYGLETAAWNSTINPAVAESPFAGTFALRVAVHAPYGGFQITLPKKIKKYSTLTFAAKNVPGGTRVSLIDSAGRDLGSQPVSWYSKGPFDQWSVVSIPLDNIGAYNRQIGAVTFTSEIPFTFLLDSISLTDEVVSFDPSPVLQDAQPVTLSASPLPFEPNFAEADVTLWHLGEGLFKVGSGTLVVGSDTDKGTQSFATYLRGANWTDYTAESDVLWQGDSISLIARYTSENEYVACSFNNLSSSVQIYRALKGKYDLLVETPELEFGVTGPKQRLGIRVVGDQVSCFVNGTQVLTTNTPLSASGTVSVSTWSRVAGTFNFVLSNMQVTPFVSAPPAPAPVTTFEGLDYPIQ